MMPGLPFAALGVMAYLPALGPVNAPPPTVALAKAPDDVRVTPYKISPFTKPLAVNPVMPVTELPTYATPLAVVTVP